LRAEKRKSWRQLFFIGSFSFFSLLFSPRLGFTQDPSGPQRDSSLETIERRLQKETTGALEEERDEKPKPEIQSVVSLLAAFLLALAWVGASSFIFQQRGILFSVFHPLLLIFSLFIFSAFYSLIVTRRERKEFFDLATRDGLTGLYVIRYFRQVMNEAVTDARFRKRPLSLIILDIDHFKDVNDTYGHPAGDFILKEIAGVLSEQTRHLRPPNTTDVVARYGGEEFIVLLRNCKLHHAAFGVAERLRPGENVPDLMIHRADAALYRAKGEGRNRVCLESSSD